MEPRSPSAPTSGSSPSPDSASPGPRVRAFIAVNLSVATVRQIAAAADAMRAAARQQRLRVAWVPAANMHLTVKFLGDIRKQAAEAIGDLLRWRLAGRSPFRLAAARAGAFPGPSQARVLWVGIDDLDGGLAALQRDVEEWMASLGFAREQRDFRPHLTVGRVHDGGSAVAVLEPHLGKQFGQSLVGEVVLYESRLQRAGAEYVALARVGLGGPPGEARTAGTAAAGGPTGPGAAGANAANAATAAHSAPSSPAPASEESKHGN